MRKSIRFNYLYRDSGNYKKYGRKIFSNPEQLTLEEITRQLTESLIDQQFFYPEKVGIEKFRFHRALDDTSWYEFESVEEIKKHTWHQKQPTIKSFLENLRKEIGGENLKRE